MVGQLAAGVAHEINNPLTGIVTYSQLLLEKTPGEGSTRSSLQKIVTQANRCRKIVRGLLDFSRQSKPDERPCNVNTVLQECVALVANQALFQNIEIVRNLAEDLPLVPMDPSQIQQVFMNLIINAAEATPGEGRLTLTTRLAASGKVRRGRVRGHRLRHQAGGPGADLRAVLHDQGSAPRHRPGPGDQLRHRQGAPGHHRGRERGRQGHHVRGEPAVVAGGGGVGRGQAQQDPDHRRRGDRPRLVPRDPRGRGLRDRHGPRRDRGPEEGAGGPARPGPRGPDDAGHLGLRGARGDARHRPDHRRHRHHRLLDGGVGGRGDEAGGVRLPAQAVHARRAAPDRPARPRAPAAGPRDHRRCAASGRCCSRTSPPSSRTSCARR